ncbi:hypothetical protein CQW23_12342 [Capsicum baccatum]|uniref:Uncharacterized protein n=1 Tax=Capsicum baccatum TaxID=33114 RepID=A0A2G2WSC0_CAPBA|nr:hypothetical protein CQW23_12342 [Capsicum baccatum]
MGSDWCWKSHDYCSDNHAIVVPNKGYLGRPPVELEDPLILIHEKKISSINALVRALELALKVVTEKLGLSIENMEFEMLGTCKKVVLLCHLDIVTISKNDTAILDGAGQKKSIEERCEQIKSTIESSTSDYDKKKLQEILDKISGVLLKCMFKGSFRTFCKLMSTLEL